MAKPLRIIIDGFNLALPRGTGVATYGYNLALAAQGLGYEVGGLYGARAPFNRRLREIMFYESLGNEHVTRAPKIARPTWFAELTMLARTKRSREIPVQGKVVKDQFAYRLPDFDQIYTAPDLFDLATRHFKRFGTFLRVKVDNPPDIMHWTYPLPVRLLGTQNIYTLHDLVPLKLPFASLDNKRHYYKLIRACLRKGDHICTVSEASREDIFELFPKEAARVPVTNTYQAVRMPQAVLDASDEEIERMVRNIFNLPYKDYYMFFGAVEPKKNVARLIEAYLSTSTKSPLVIVGTRAWGSDVELRLLQKDEVQPLKATFRNIRRIDYLPRSLLMRMVRGAKAVAFPSLYEGFGLPALEAMMLGTPVITSNSSSLAEVAGNAALTVDPYKPREMADAIELMDRDPDLRARLSVAGREQAAQYGMEKYQEQLKLMYESILGVKS